MRMGQDNDYKDLWNHQREDKSSDSGTDDEYKIFLDHLKADGGSYVLEMSPVYVKYEEEYDHFSENATDMQGNLQTCSRQQMHVTCKEQLPNSQSKRDFPPSNIVKYLKWEKTVIDPCYLVFLHHIRVSGASVILKLDNGITIQYGDEVDSPNAFIKTKATPFSSEEPQLHDDSSMLSNFFVAKFVDNNTSTENSRSCEMSYFRNGLKTLCDKPFDKEEYQSLLKEISTRKPIKRGRELRRVTKTYQTGSLGKSYLDCYPDFMERISTACCINHRLKQLRGFIFWIQNLAHVGAFVPWQDEHFNVCGNC